MFEYNLINASGRKTTFFRDIVQDNFFNKWNALTFNIINRRMVF